MNRLPKALIVNDDEVMRRGCTLALEEVNWTTEATGEALHGLRLAVSNHYDAILLDLELAATNGIWFLKELRRTKPDVPVLVITGYPNAAKELLATDRGPRELLAAPFTPELLTHAVLRVTGTALISGAAAALPAAPIVVPELATGTSKDRKEPAISPVGRALLALLSAVVFNPSPLVAIVLLVSLLVVALEGGVGELLRGGAQANLHGIVSVGVFILGVCMFICMALGQLIVSFIAGWRGSDR